MRQPRRKQISVDEIRRIVAHPDWQKDDILLQRVRSASQNPHIPTFASVYRNVVTDETILEYINNYGGFLQSLSELEKFIATIQKPVRLGPRHMLDGRLPYGQDFPNHTGELVQPLPALLGLPPDDLDFTLDSLKAFDTAILELQFEDCLEQSIFPGLVAYCGETLCRVGPGRWEMRQDREFPAVWWPWIIPTQGRAINLGFYVYKELEEGDPFSLYGCVAGLLWMSQNFK